MPHIALSRTWSPLRNLLVLWLAKSTTTPNHTQTIISLSPATIVVKLKHESSFLLGQGIAVRYRRLPFSMISGSKVGIQFCACAISVIVDGKPLI